mgnify:CR=1 FL=1
MTSDSIDRYYLDRLKKYDGEIRKAIEDILGNEFCALYDICKDTFIPVFMASKDGIEYFLGETPTNEENKVLENLLEKMEDDEQIIYLNEAIRDNSNNVCVDFFRDPKRIQVHRTMDDCNLLTFGKLDVFSNTRDGIFLDYSYIYILVSHLVQNYFVKTKTTPSLSDDEITLWNLILGGVSVQIVALLRRKNIFILDREDEYNEELFRSKYFLYSPNFIKKISHLYTGLLLRPNELKKQIGETDFKRLLDDFLNADVVFNDNDNAFDWELYKKLASIPRFEFPIRFYKKKISEDKLGINDFNVLKTSFIKQIELLVKHSGIWTYTGIDRECLIKKTGLNFLRDFEVNFKECVEDIYDRYYKKAHFTTYESSSLSLTMFLYKCFFEFIDVINKQYHRNIDKYDVYILELNNASLDDSNNYPMSVLMFDIDGEYYVCDGWSYLFAMQNTWNMQPEINSEELTRFRDDAKKYLMMPLGDYLNRKTYFPESGIQFIDENNFGMSINIDSSLIYIPSGLDDKRMCNEIPSMSLKEFLGKKDVKSHS